MTKKDQIAEAIRETFVSPNVGDSNLEPAGLVDVVNFVALGLNKVARAITPDDAMPGHTSQGGHVESLTEAVMGLEAALNHIAESLSSIAIAITELKK